MSAPHLYIFLGTVIAFVGGFLLFVGVEDGSTGGVMVAWAVLYVASIVTSIGVIGAGIQLARKD